LDIFQPVRIMTKIIIRVIVIKGFNKIKESKD